MGDVQTLSAWPSLPYEEWRETRDTLHMYTQVIGKLRLALSPFEPEWAHVPLYVSARGLTTSTVPVGLRTIDAELDLVDHALVVRSNDGDIERRPLGGSVADFYQDVMRALQRLRVDVAVSVLPSEVADPIAFPEDRTLQITGSFARSDGWQDRTKFNVFRGGATLGFGLGKSRNTLDLLGYNDEQDWGTPLPYDAGAIVPGFKVDRNYAISGAEVKHRVFGGTLRTQLPLSEPYRIENTLGLTSDSQDFLRSFTGAVIPPDTVESVGLELGPTETSLYEDMRLVAHFKGAGTHEAVFGAALTWGETKGSAHEFEFDQVLSRYPEIPSTPDTGDFRDFEDRRTFFGLYAHDAWTPQPRVTFECGARLDLVSEELETEQDQPTGPTKVKDNRDDTDVSGDISALVRLLPEGGAKRIQTMNLYGSVRRGFKPAAPNLAEAEAAEILEPEHTTSWEVGLKTRALEEVGVDLSYIDMTFENMVVSILGPGGGPELTNAGKERFKGFEADARWAPRAFAGSSIQVGYAHHDARFVDFTFVTPDSQLRDVSGKHLELVPQELCNVRVNVQMPAGIGLWGAMRYQGERPFNRRNTFFADPYTEWDAGASWNRAKWRVSVVGRNLSDDRHVVTESEIGDSQFYVAPPARVTAEVAYRF